MTPHSRGVASRLRWALMPWWAFAWRYRNDWIDAPNPCRWWHHCIGSAALWLDKILERTPGGALWEPKPPVNCDCDYCRGVPGAVYEP